MSNLSISEHQVWPSESTCNIKKEQIIEKSYSCKGDAFHKLGDKFGSLSEKFSEINHKFKGGASNCATKSDKKIPLILKQYKINWNHGSMLNPIEIKEIDSTDSSIPITTHVEGSEETDKDVSKNEQKRIQKKMNRKLAQGLAALKKAEKKELDEMISKTPTNKIFVFHFGNGDEEDQRVLLEFCKRFGPIDQLPLFPGLNYGYIEYPDIKQAEDLMSSLVEKQFLDLEFYGKKRTCFFQYCKLEYSQLDRFKTMEFPNSVYECDIPGLIIVDEFVSEEEERQLIEYLDSQNWVKLMNRRVQHYGYEFVYGANNVNKTDKIRGMPSEDSDIFKIVNERLNDTLKGFYIQENNEAIRIYDHNKNLVYEDEKLAENLTNYFEKYGEFDQCTVNDYQPGQGIPPHVDTHSPFEEVFCCISLHTLNNEMKYYNYYKI